MSARKFEYVDSKSSKYWNIELQGKEVVTSYGRIGSSGQQTSKSFGSAALAQKEYDKLIEQKTKKGYVEVGGKKGSKSAAKSVAAKTSAAKSTTAKSSAAIKGAAKPGKKTAAKAPSTPKSAVAKSAVARKSSKKPAASKASAKREFHFVSGSSSKFWTIELKGTEFEITYGKLGAAGRPQTKEFASEEKARAAAEKLIEEKMAKGYAEVSGVAGSSTGGASGGISPAMFATTRSVDDMEKLSTFIGKRVVNFVTEKSIKPGDKHVYRIGVSWDTDDEHSGDPDFFAARLKTFLQTDAALASTGLIIGNWSLEDILPAAPVVKILVDHKDRLPNLKALFFGDIAQYECELSWIRQTDLSPLLKAFPQLEMLRVRGGDGLSFKSLKHKSLRALALETGGLDRKIVAQICKADLPNLEYLELWLGTDNYGGNTRINDLQPLLKGKLFKKLRYLGLRNSDITDEIAGVLVNAPITQQLETIDLSLGTLTDEGANALLRLPALPQLKSLDLHYHYMSKPVMKKFKAMPVTVNVSGQETPHDWGDGERRFVAVGE
jgi:predicted DNA-binding WGR domain protein